MHLIKPVESWNKGSDNLSNCLLTVIASIPPPAALSCRETDDGCRIPWLRMTVTIIILIIIIIILGKIRYLRRFFGLNLWNGFTRWHGHCAVSILHSTNSTNSTVFTSFNNDIWRMQSKRIIMLASSIWCAFAICLKYSSNYSLHSLNETEFS